MYTPNNNNHNPNRRPPAGSSTARASNQHGARRRPAAGSGSVYYTKVGNVGGVRSVAVGTGAGMRARAGAGQGQQQQRPGNRRKQPYLLIHPVVQVLAVSLIVDLGVILLNAARVVELPQYLLTFAQWLVLGLLVVVPGSCIVLIAVWLLRRLLAHRFFQAQTRRYEQSEGGGQGENEDDFYDDDDEEYETEEAGVGANEEYYTPAQPRPQPQPQVRLAANGWVAAGGNGNNRRGEEEVIINSYQHQQQRRATTAAAGMGNNAPQPPAPRPATLLEQAEAFADGISNPHNPLEGVPSRVIDRTGDGADSNGVDTWGVICNEQHYQQHSIRKINPAEAGRLVEHYRGLGNNSNSGGGGTTAINSEAGANRLNVPQG